MAEVFDFSDYRTYLRASQRKHPVTKRAITLEDWAKRLKYKSPRSIAMVIKGQRIPSRDLVEAFANDLQLDTARQRYFELLVLRDKHEQEGTRLDGIQQELESLNHKKLNRRIIDEKKFSHISDWHFTVLRALIVMPDFQENSTWIAKKLRNKITPDQVRKGLEDLVRHGHLMRHEGTGELQLPSDSRLSTESEIPSVAIRRHHAQMMQRAVESLTEQDIAKRQFLSSTIQVDRAKIGEAKTVLLEFLDGFYKRFTTSRFNSIYQVSVQFFEHTDPEVK